MKRVFQHLSDMFLERVNSAEKTLGNRSSSTNINIDTDRYELLKMYIIIMTHASEMNSDDIQKLKELAENPIKNHEEIWKIIHTHTIFSNIFTPTFKKHASIFSYAKQVHNEEAAIKRIETSAYWRALLFRVGQTFLIGATIMLIYWIAHCWGVPMPLMKLST